MSGMQAERAKLIGLVDLYLEALAANDPSRLPLAPEVKFTENCQRLALGKGLWATASDDKPYRKVAYVADQEKGQIGFFGVVRESETPAILALRLKAESRRISEIETLVVRRRENIFAPDALTGPRPIFEETIAPSERSSRTELIGAANLYFDGIERNDGNIIPVAADCIRIENGVQTTMNRTPVLSTGFSGFGKYGLFTLGVADQINTGCYKYIAEIRERRYVAVDEERGLVLAFVFFEHPGTERSVELPGVGKIDLPPAVRHPNSALIAELFKVRAGRIRHIEAVLDFFPYGMKSGWD